jgi:site-specific DNA-methyltransferase (adenine-specific)
MLYCGDCMDVLPTLESKSVDLILVDLPYGVTKNNWDCEIDLDLMWKQLRRISKPKCNFLFFTTTRYGYKLIQSNPNMFRYDIVWNKPNCNCGHLTANRAVMRRHEMIYLFGRNSCGTKTYNSQKEDDRHAGSVWTGGGRGKYHQTQKPTDLLEWLIRTYSNEGDVVLDFTMGSGSCGVACKNTGREFIGIEKDERIFKIAEQRVREYFPQTP